MILRKPLGSCRKWLTSSAARLLRFLKTLPIVRWQTAPIRSTIFLAVHNMNSVSQHKGKPSGPPFISVRPCCEGGSGFELVGCCHPKIPDGFHLPIWRGLVSECREINEPLTASTRMVPGGWH
jgi:hypothetical protein